MRQEDPRKYTVPAREPTDSRYPSMLHSEAESAWDHSSALVSYYLRTDHELGDPEVKWAKQIRQRAVSLKRTIDTFQSYVDTYRNEVKQIEHAVNTDGHDPLPHRERAVALAQRIEQLASEIIELHENEESPPNYLGGHPDTFNIAVARDKLLDADDPDNYDGEYVDVGIGSKNERVNPHHSLRYLSHADLDPSDHLDGYTDFAAKAEENIESMIDGLRNYDPEPRRTKDRDYDGPEPI